LEYSEKVNTLNSTDTPYNEIAEKMKTAQEAAAVVDTTKTPAETTAHH
jgi:hypothetical protein